MKVTKSVLLSRKQVTEIPGRPELKIGAEFISTHSDGKVIREKVYSLIKKVWIDSNLYYDWENTEYMVVCESACVYYPSEIEPEEVFPELSISPGEVKALGRILSEELLEVDEYFSRELSLDGSGDCFAEVEAAQARTEARVIKIMLDRFGVAGERKALFHTFGLYYDLHYSLGKVSYKPWEVAFTFLWEE